MAQEESPIVIQSETLKGMKLFAGNAHPELANRVAAELGVSLGKMDSTKFADGEIRLTVEESARGNEIFILQPTCFPTNDNLMELFIMLDAFRRASAQRITVVIPYYGYARQDKKVKPREPITARLIADIIENCGADRVVAVDLHAQQLQGFFNIPVDHLYGGPILGAYFAERGFAGTDDVAVVSPDAAGVSRASALARMLGAQLVVINKRRPEPNQSEVVEVVGNFRGKRCLMIDDMIDTGGSIINGAQALMDRGATEVRACCTHAVFSLNAAEKLQNSAIQEVVVLDTIPIGAEKQFAKLTVLPVAPLIANAIRRIYSNQSVSALFDDWK
jgi:ribose-phosphate pyrophosphokinase